MPWKYMTGQRKKLITTGVKICIAVLWLLICQISFFLPPTYGDTTEKLKIYIVYESITYYGDDFPLVTVLKEYLGHFDSVCREVPLASWRPGALKEADIVVYAGLEKEELPPELLREMAAAKRVIWFGKNIEQMAAYLKWSDFQPAEATSGWLYLNYKEDKRFAEWANVVAVQPGEDAVVLATVKNIAGEMPIAWQRDNIYFCGCLSFGPFFDCILADLLHEFIPNNHSHLRTAFLRVEDVSPLVAPKAVKAVVETIEKYHIPFAIGVIPVGVTNGSRIYLHERPELVKVLRDAQQNGASIIMHGYTHQNEYSPATGEGYEFWNARDDKPMENDETFTKERLEAGLAELARCGLIPVAFEPPHYAMSKTGYEVLSQYFNIFSGEIQVSDKSAKITSTLPYIIRSPYLNGMLVIPENMGYYDGKDFTMETILENLSRVTTVRDSLACFFFHGYLPPDKLGPIIEAVQNQGYEFLDLSLLQIKIRSPRVKITGGNGYIDVEVDEELKASWKTTQPQKTVLEQIGEVHVAVLLLITLAFLIIILRLRSNANRHYEG